jgi:hypothetical protein
MIAYQPVDPASGMTATRLSLSQLTGRFLCRRVRRSFGRAALFDLLDESRTVTCRCGHRFDAQILGVEKLTRDTAEVGRFAECPECHYWREDHLQFRRDGLILAREEGAWFIWLSQVRPNRYGNAMEEHLFWHDVDWSQCNTDLAQQLNVPEEIIRAWRRKVGKPLSVMASSSRKPARSARSAEKRHR